MPDRENAIVIAMARQAADVTADARGRETFSFDDYGLIRFAALVAAQEREQCALACEAGMDHSMEHRMLSKTHQLNGADGELEALKFWSTVSLYNNARRLCAVAIRARKEET